MTFTLHLAGTAVLCLAHLLYSELQHHKVFICFQILIIVTITQLEISPI